MHGVARLLPVSVVEGAGGGTRMHTYMYTCLATRPLFCCSGLWFSAKNIGLVYGDRMDSSKSKADMARLSGVAF